VVDNAALIFTSKEILKKVYDNSTLKGISCSNYKENEHIYHNREIKLNELIDIIKNNSYILFLNDYNRIDNTNKNIHQIDDNTKIDELNNNNKINNSMINNFKKILKPAIIEKKEVKYKCDVNNMNYYNLILEESIYNTLLTEEIKKQLIEMRKKQLNNKQIIEIEKYWRDVYYREVLGNVVWNTLYPHSINVLNNVLNRDAKKNKREEIEKEKEKGYYKKLEEYDKNISHAYIEIIGDNVLIVFDYILSKSIIQYRIKQYELKYKLSEGYFEIYHLQDNIVKTKWDNNLPFIETPNEQ
jgi:hypothetical protein